MKKSSLSKIALLLHNSDFQNVTLQFWFLKPKYLVRFGFGTTDKLILMWIKGLLSKEKSLIQKLDFWKIQKS